jgi:hypothetical protein
VTTFVAESATVPPGSDTTPDLVTAAARHLRDFRTGAAQALETLAELAATRMPDDGQKLLEPLLRILGADKADAYAHDLYVAACKTIGGWDPDIDPDAAARRLARITRDAAHDIADEIQKDTRICCAATKEKSDVE